MKKIYSKVKPFVFLLIFTLALSALFLAAADWSSREQTGKELVSREANEASAEKIVKEANDAFSKNQYKKAVDKYLEAIGILRKSDPENLSSYVQQKIETCQQAISNAYYYWSLELADEAEKMVKAKEYDKAISLCERAMKVYPPSRLRLEQAIKKYKGMKKAVTFRSETSEENVDSGKEKREYKIDVLLKQGMVLYNDGQLDKARNKFEEVLMIDPYQIKAIDYIRKANIKLLEKGGDRTRLTRNERMAEIQWKMITPIVPRTLSGASETIQVTQKKESATDKIQDKLRNIIIDHIEFEEVTIPTVVKYLKQRSKQLDPEGVGVNIFLRLAAGRPTAPAAAPAAKAGNAGAAADDWGDAWGDEGGGEKKDTGNAGGAGNNDPWGDNAAAASSGTAASLGEVPTVTLVVDDIPLGSAIKYICQSASLKYRIEKYAVVIASQNVALEDVETEIYPLEQEALDTLGGGEDPEAVKKHFESRGVNFPTGAKIVYDKTISRLIATNTPENLKKIEEIIHNELNAVDPQVLIQAKFVEVQQNDLEELGFQYTVSRQSSNAQWFPVSELTGMPDPAEGSITVPYPTSTYDASGNYTGSNTAGHTYTSADSGYYHKAIAQKGQTWDANSQLLRTVNNDGLGNVTVGSRPDQVINWTHYDSTGLRVNAIVTALDQADTSDVLSTPRVTTMNGQEATIRMITERYYPESWGEAEMTDSGVFVSSIPTFGDPTEEGIILRVTPNVDADRYTITLDMNPVVQERTGWTDYSYGVYVGSGANSTLRNNVMVMPEIEARTVETTVTIYDGETILLGGIIKDSTNTIDDKYPILGELPLVGRLFQSKAKSSSKTNLLIFLTCRLVNPDGSPIRERELRGLPPFRQ